MRRQGHRAMLALGLEVSPCWIINTWYPLLGQSTFYLTKLSDRSDNRLAKINSGPRSTL